MTVIEFIKTSLINNNFNFSEHAYLRALERNISLEEIIEISANFEIIEDYPLDKYSPTCLVLGFTRNNRPIHIQVTANTSSLLKIITLYQPEDDKWINNFRGRK